MTVRNASGTTLPSDSEKEARRELLREICHRLPEATSEGDQHVVFRVRSRTFAYYLDDHHGDGRVAVACKTRLGEHEELAARDPVCYFVPPYVGPRGWVGPRLDGPEVDWDEAAELIAESYRLVAPKRLARLAERLLALEEEETGA